LNKSKLRIIYILNFIIVVVINRNSKAMYVFAFKGRFKVLVRILINNEILLETL